MAARAVAGLAAKAIAAIQAAASAAGARTSSAARRGAAVAAAGAGAERAALALCVLACHIWHMHKSTLYLEEGLYERLVRVAQERDATQALVIREALQAYLSPTQRAPRSIGLGRSGKALKGRLSERAEALLKGMGQGE